MDEPIRETKAPEHSDGSNEPSASLPRGGGRRAGDAIPAGRGAAGSDAHEASRARPPGRSPAERLEECFERRIADYTSAARRARTASDAEAIHDLRVATRRLTAALRTWRSLIPNEAGRAACRALRRLRRRLGDARELEVHIELLEARLPARRTVTRAMAAALLLRLKGRLARRRPAASRRVSPRRVKRLLHLLEDAVAGLPTRLLRDPGAVEDALSVEREVGALARDAMRQAAENPDDTLLHEARIRVKKWRYTIECLDEALSGRSSHGIRALRRLQAALGNIHDRIVLRGVIARYAPDPGDDDGEHPMRPLTDKLEAERRRALAKFQRLAADPVGAPQSATPTTPAAGAPSPPAMTTRPAPSAAPVIEPVPSGSAAAIVSKDAVLGDAATGSLPETPAPKPEFRDERWGRMANWLEKLEDGS